MRKLCRDFVWLLQIALLIAPFCILSCDKYSQYKTPGLYCEGSALAKTDFEFERRPMVGLTINHYADGCYYVLSNPNFIQTKEPITLYLVPNRPVTMGGADEWKGTIFETKRSIDIVRVRDNGQFTCVNRGRKQDDEVTCVMTTLKDEVQESNGGLVKHRQQLIRIDFAVPKGQYVIFEGEGNTADKDTYPSKEQQCWYIEVL